MSLWVDSQFVTPADLNAEDPEVATGTDRSIDAAEHITLTGSNGLINRILNECASQLSRSSESWGRARVGDRGADHLLILQDSLRAGERSRPRWLIEQVVVTGARPLELSALKSWVIDRCLEGIYLRSVNKPESDRYLARLELRQNRIKWDTWPKLRDTGVPIVNQPLFAPGAVQVADSGTWGDGNLSSVASSGTAGGTFTCVVTWIKDGYRSTDDQGVHESGPSALATATVPAGSVLGVDIGTLNPPEGGSLNLGTGQIVLPIAKATGWNVYVGPDEENLYLQNATPLDLGTTTYTLPADPVTNTVKVFHGQNADALVQMQPQWMRA